MKVKVGDLDGGHRREAVTAMSESMSRLRDQLDRWTAAGIIDAGQAAEMESAERARAGAGSAGPRSRRALPQVVEVLGYLGAAIAISAGFVVVRQFWPRMPSAATLVFTAVAAVSLIVVGAVLRTGGQPPYARLRSVLWLMATAAGADFAAILASNVLHLGDHGVLLTAAAAWAGVAIALWWFGKSALQHVVMFGGLVALLSAGLYQMYPALTVVGYGTAIWAFSVLWGVAAYRAYLTPPTAGLAVASIGVLAGATMTMGNPAGQALALLTVAGLLAIGVAMHKVMFVCFGAAGTLWVIPVTANRYLPGSAAAPMAVTVAGIVLLAISLWLARARKHSG
jgi:hypothetical protein